VRLVYGEDFLFMPYHKFCYFISGRNRVTTSHFERYNW